MTSNQYYYLIAILHLVKADHNSRSPNSILAFAIDPKWLPEFQAVKPNAKVHIIPYTELSVHASCNCLPAFFRSAFIKGIQDFKYYGSVRENGLIFRNVLVTRAFFCRSFIRIGGSAFSLIERPENMGLLNIIPTKASFSNEQTLKLSGGEAGCIIVRPGKYNFTITSPTVVGDSDNRHISILF